jgi:hypothetical protein
VEGSFLQFAPFASFAVNPLSRWQDSDSVILIREIFLAYEDFNEEARMNAGEELPGFLASSFLSVLVAATLRWVV